MSDAPTTSSVGESPRFTQRPADDPTYNVDPGKGWVLFAGIMLGLVGVLNLIYGIGAIADSRFYVRDVAYVFGNLNTWGWLLTVVGGVQLIASAGVFMAGDGAAGSASRSPPSTASSSSWSCPPTRCGRSWSSWST